MDLEALLRNVDIESAEKRFVVTDEAGSPLMVKILEVYDIEVYKFLLRYSDPHIPRIFAILQKDGRLIVAEEYIPGVSLTEFAAEVDLDRDQRINILCSVCDALRFLHSARPMIIHRDVKPDNILISHSGNVYLADYNAAKFYRPGFSRDTVLIGTAGVAAPEQYGFAQSDQRTDIYGVGKLAEYLFPIGIRQRWMDNIIKKATSLDPSERFKNVDILKKSFIEHRVATSILPLPGYRDAKVGTEIAATLGYIAIVIFYLIIIGAFAKWDFSEYSLLPEGAPGGSFLFALAVFILGNLYVFMIYDMFSNCFGLYRWMPFINSKWHIRQPVALGYSIVLYFLIVYYSTIGVDALVAVNAVSLIVYIARRIGRNLPVKRPAKKIYEPTEEDRNV